MRKVLSTILFNLVFFILLAPNLTSAKSLPFSNVVLFGDSLSDTGNLYYYDYGFLPKSPPYHLGRFSNGNIWVDHLIPYLKDQGITKTTNYAVGGETAIIHNPIQGFLPFTLYLSLKNYLVQSAYQDRSNTLFIVWIGANDYLYPFTNMQQLTEEVIASIRSTIESLIEHGGKHFLVINLTDLSETPFADPLNYKDQLSIVTNLHNSKLSNMIAEVQQNDKNIDLKLYDAYSFLKDFILHPDDYNKTHETHIQNTTEACWKGGYTLKNPVNAETLESEINALIPSPNNQSSNHLIRVSDNHELAHYIANNPSLLEAYKVSKSSIGTVDVCANPDDYVFWDSLHPSAAMHKVMAERMILFIKEHYLK